jgi:rfaE bifunctional protein nucleotidyltransferase chain/domain
VGRRGRLFVALNSDRSVRQLKGPQRPILDERSRAYNLAQLASVDGIVIFRRPRLVREIKALRPDIYAKAGDYTLETLDPAERAALAQVGARITFLPYLAGFSTTALVAKIRAAGGL